MAKSEKDTITWLKYSSRRKKLQNQPPQGKYPLYAKRRREREGKRIEARNTPRSSELVPSTPFHLIVVVVSRCPAIRMGSENGAISTRKPRFLGLHGFRTNGEILRKQIKKWPEEVRERLDLVFVDAPFPCQGKSDVEGIFDPPYYEWFQFNKEFTEYTNLNECLEYIENCIIKYGPFDGLVGFSQGAILSAALPGLQAKGLALQKVPKIKFLIIIGGAKFKSESWADKAYSSPIECPSLHFLGKEDFLRPYGSELLESCIAPVVIHHPKGHTIPRLDEQGLQEMHNFIDKIEKILTGEKEAEAPPPLEAAAS